MFREKQARLFGTILESFESGRIGQISACLQSEPHGNGHTQGDPDTLPLFVPEAADETVEFQINAIADALEILKESRT